MAAKYDDILYRALTSFSCILTYSRSWQEFFVNSVPENLEYRHVCGPQARRNLEVPNLMG